MGIIGKSPEQIKALLLTHTDRVNAGSTSLFANAVIYMHYDEEQMINSTTGKTKYSKTRKYGPYTILESNDTFITDGLKIQVLHTPGHAPRS